MLLLQSHKTHNLNTIKMREHLKQIDKDDIAGAILISVTVYITFYITSIIQSL